MPAWVRWTWATLALVAAVALAVTKLWGVVTLFALAGILAAGLHPVVRALERRGVPHGAAVPLTLLGVAAVIGGLAALLLPTVLRQLAALVQALPAHARALEGMLAGLEEVAGRAPFLPSLAEVSARITALALAGMRGLAGMASQLAGLVGTAFLMLIVTSFLLQDGTMLREHAMKLVPPARRDAARDLLGRIVERVGKYTLGTATEALIISSLTATGYWLIGLPNALALGCIVGLCNLVPFVGAAIGSIPAMVVAFGLSPQTGLMALAVTFGVQQLEGLVIYPRVVGRAVGLHPIYVMIAFMTGLQLVGVVGVFLGIPAAVVAKTLLETLVIQEPAREVAPPGTVRRTEMNAIEPNGAKTVSIGPSWAALAGTGVVSILLGIAAFNMPLVTLGSLVLAFGAHALATGTAMVVAGLVGGPVVMASWRGGLVAVGILSVLAGLAVLFWPAISAVVLYTMVACWAIAGGLAQIIGAVAEPEKFRHVWLVGIGGLMMVVFGGFLLATPAGVAALAIALGTYAMAYGVTMLGAAIVAREQPERVTVNITRMESPVAEREETPFGR